MAPRTVIFSVDDLLKVLGSEAASRSGLSSGRYHIELETNHGEDRKLQSITVTVGPDRGEK